MVEDNMNKIHWIIAVIVIIGAIATFILTPAYNKIKAQEKQITDINFSTPTN